MKLICVRGRTGCRSRRRHASTCEHGGVVAVVTNTVYEQRRGGGFEGVKLRLCGFGGVTGMRQQGVLVYASVCKRMQWCMQCAHTLTAKTNWKRSNSGPRLTAFEPVHTLLTSEDLRRDSTHKLQLIKTESSRFKQKQPQRSTLPNPRNQSAASLTTVT